MLMCEPDADWHPIHATAATPAKPTCVYVLTAMSDARTIAWQGRDLVLDPDCYLVLNLAEAASAPAAMDPSVLVLKFDGTQLRLAGAAAGVQPFLEHLRLSDEPVGALLGGLRRNLCAAQRTAQPDPATLLDLLRRLVAEEFLLQQRMRSIDCVKPSTRRELVRRVLLASDFILSHHESPIRLDDVALAAHLSRFHLTRLFRQLLGVTPHTLLLNKRLAAARRLLAQGRGDMSEVAAKSGFGNRWSLFRRLQRHPEGSPPSPQSLLSGPPAPASG